MTYFKLFYLWCIKFCVHDIYVLVLFFPPLIKWTFLYILFSFFINLCFLYFFIIYYFVLYSNIFHFQCFKFIYWYSMRYICDAHIVYMLSLLYIFISSHYIHKMLITWCIWGYSCSINVLFHDVSLIIHIVPIKCSVVYSRLFE
jgi:hypothetical protein